MYISYHYPFPILSFSINDEAYFLSKENLKIHYNLYKNDVEKLNSLLAGYPSFKTWNLEELIFYANKLPKKIRNEVVKYSGSVFNHQIFFNSLGSSNTTIPNQVMTAILGSFSSFSSFCLEFTKACENFDDFGFVFLCIDSSKRLVIVPVHLNDTTIPLNLYPLFGIDLYEHSYYLDFIFNPREYYNLFINHINWNYVLDELNECQKFFK